MQDYRNKLVAISHNPMSLKLIRSCYSKMAKSDVGYCLYVQTAYQGLNESQKQSLQKNIETAEKLGFKFFTIESPSVHEGIINFIKENNIESLTIGSTRKRFISGSNYNKILSDLPDIEMNVFKLRKVSDIKYPFSLSKFSISDFLATIALVAIATFINYLAFYTYKFIDHTTFGVSMIYILAVLITVTRYGFVNALISSIISALCINYYFTKPAYQFLIDEASDTTNLVFFIVMSVVISALTSFSAKRNQSFIRRDVLNQHILGLGDKLVGVTKVGNIKKILEEEISKILGTTSKVYIADENSKFRFKYKDNLPEETIVNINLCYTKQSSVVEEGYMIHPISTKQSKLGVILIEEVEDKIKDLSFERLITSLTNLAANALERATLSKELDETETLKEKEKLRADLLSSVSHDLKTPLASIIGSLTAMEHMKGSLDEEAIETLRVTAVEEAERLNQFITNILEMTKLECGGIKLDKKLHSPDEIISETIDRLKNKTEGHIVSHIKNFDNVEVNVDKLLLGQVLQNLIVNAVQYSEPNTKIEISTKMEDGKFYILVVDEGFGIEDEMKEKIFDKFERIKLADKKIAGTGLGLAICKSMVELLGGKILIEDNSKSSTGTGTIFKIEL